MPIPVDPIDLEHIRHCHPRERPIGPHLLAQLHNLARRAHRVQLRDLPYTELERCAADAGVGERASLSVAEEELLGPPLADADATSAASAAVGAALVSLVA